MELMHQAGSNLPEKLGCKNQHLWPPQRQILKEIFLGLKPLENLFFLVLT